MTAPHGRVAFALGLALALTPAALSAQAEPSWEVAAGFGWLGGSPVGAATALETRNQVGGGPRLTLFDVDGRIESSRATTARVAFRVNPTFAVEAGFSYARPVLTTDISGDFEGSPDLTVQADPFRQYVIDVGVVVHLRRLRFGGGGLPFVSAATGYLRELTDDRTVIETGRTYRLGGGVKQPFGRRAGLRFDAGLGVRDGGFSLDEPRARAFLVAGLGAFFVF